MLTPPRFPLAYSWRVISRSLKTSTKKKPTDCVPRKIVPLLHYSLKKQKNKKKKKKSKGDKTETALRVTAKSNHARVPNPHVSTSQ